MTRAKAIEILKKLIEAMQGHVTVLPTPERIAAIRLAIASLETDEAYQLEYERTTKNDLGVDWESYKDIDGNSLDDLILEVLQSNFDCGNTYGYKVADEIIGLLPSVTPQLSSELEKNSKKLEKIRDQLKSNLRGVEITLEVLVENDPLRPKMEGAKTTLEDCLELIEQAEAESI
ncbi:MAG: hypothetical protein IIY21_15550 [Clostridiales bacterium]|nr:hypothetical protein [Clostridiales bacterium]